MLRYLGIYRPGGFHFNKFMVFYIKNPLGYTKAIVKKIKQMENSNTKYDIRFNSPILNDPVIVFTDKEYVNYKDVHKSLCLYLDKDSYVSCMDNYCEWPIVTIDNDILNSYDCLDDIIRDARINDDSYLNHRYI